jgi:octaheme c-type cytochrome (tetrathionate reductase family)
MLKSRLFAVLTAIALALPGFAAHASDVKLNTTADHSKFKELQREFTSGPEVTKACLGCHTEAALQIHRTKHWTWEVVNPLNQQRLGKKNVINNYCISTATNLGACASCHVGYGWVNSSFDFKSQENVDCLVCHDTSGNYKKLPGGGQPPVKDTENPPGSGKIVKAIDLTKVAQKVGKTSRDTCGACHFFGGGGDGVKHGDMDTSLASPDKEVDVHMDATGLDFTCSTCHKAPAHDVVGSRYTPTGKDAGDAHMRGKVNKSNPATCQSCHGQTPHKAGAQAAKLNQHTDKLACQTCHIPQFARGGVPTKMHWDWSTAGKLSPEGKPMLKKDAKGHIIYDSRKGDFVVAENVTPEYGWFNGEVTYTLLGDTVGREKGVTLINALGGSATDGRSLIWPMKVMRGSQPYDPVNKTLVKPHVAGNDDTAFWKNFNWEKAITTGMQAVNAPFSGKVDFLETEMYWPITHMVAPKEKAVGCNECHTRGGRMDKIEGVYIPGRDANPLVNLLGWLAAGAALAVVTLHGLLRVLRRKN